MDPCRHPQSVGPIRWPPALTRLPVPAISRKIVLHAPPVAYPQALADPGLVFYFRNLKNSSFFSIRRSAFTLPRVVCFPDVYPLGKDGLTIFNPAVCKIGRAHV